MNARLLVALIWFPCAALAQGFAGLGSDAEGFALPKPDKGFDFPADHGAHPDYRIEWWYLTANLTGADGRDYGIQWTLFRSALRPGDPGIKDWSSPQIWMGNAGLTSPGRHFSAQRFARGGIGQAAVTVAPFGAHIDDWHMTANGPGIDSLEVAASSEDFAYRLQLSADGPLVPQGQDGYSVKSADGTASYYYSQPFYLVGGTLTLPDGDVQVTGQAWLDREWSSQPLSDDQTGWDWFSLHLEGGQKLMGFRLRQTDGTHYTSATWIEPDGSPTPYGDGHLSATPLATASVAGREVPVRWRLELPERGLDVEVSALNDGAWMDTVFPYWEGPIMITGTHSGRGYLEMTGYE
ncbi:MAG: iron ABC transporter permease [Rhodobacteraceae bacterium]|nr:iron ABC transporter permease [Paracoccaceae bacterium]